MQMCIKLQHIHIEELLMRTNIIIDDYLMEEAITISNSKTKKEVVEKALQLLIAVSKQKNISKFRGKLKWFGDLEKSRKD